MKIGTIFSNPERYEITKFSGGYLGGAEKVSAIDSKDQYVLKRMGDTAEQISHSLILLKHIKAFGKFFTNMARLYDWEIHEDGTLIALFEYIMNTEGRLANIPEMLQISNCSFLASKQYDYTEVSAEADFSKSVLYEIKNNGLERYAEKYFSPYANKETQALIS